MQSDTGDSAQMGRSEDVLGLAQTSLNTRFEERIAGLDLDLFEPIHASMSSGDKTSFLAEVLAVRDRYSSYSYLEIGSHLGGSLQPCLRDPRCQQIYSIDKRPTVFADERGVDVCYRGNSTARMLAGLASVTKDLSKICTFDCDASGVPAENIVRRPELCFIDGEHSDRAVLADFSFVHKVIATNSVILFHDANIVFDGISKIVSGLEAKGDRFRAYCLPDKVFVIELGDPWAFQTTNVREMLFNNYRSYLPSLQGLKYYRDWYNRPIFRRFRSFKDICRKICGKSPHYINAGTK